jgi:hypothetical protein
VELWLKGGRGRGSSLVLCCGRRRGRQQVLRSKQTITVCECNERRFKAEREVSLSTYTAASSLELGSMKRDDFISDRSLHNSIIMQHLLQQPKNAADIPVMTPSLMIGRLITFYPMTPLFMSVSKSLCDILLNHLTSHPSASNFVEISRPFDRSRNRWV